MYVTSTLIIHPEDVIRAQTFDDNAGSPFIVVERRDESTAMVLIQFGVSPEPAAAIEALDHFLEQAQIVRSKLLRRAVRQATAQAQAASNGA